MNKLVGNPHTICVRYRQIMEEAMIEIIGVKEGSEVKKGEVEGLETKGGREAGEEGRIPMEAHIGFPGTPGAKVGRPKVQGKPKLHCERLP